jgi:hypothetical protein
MEFTWLTNAPSDLSYKKRAKVKGQEEGVK